MVKKGNKKHRSKEQKKIDCIVLKCFAKQGTELLDFLMIIPQWYPKQNVEQLQEQDLKY